MEKYDIDRLAADDNTIQSMRFAYWINKTRHTHTHTHTHTHIYTHKIQYLLLFRCNNGYANAPCY